MNIDRKQVEVFMVASFLIKNHGYRFVTLHQHQDEIWLGNASNMEFPVIRISSSTTESVFFDRNRILQVHQAILKVLRREGRLLDLHISNETEVETDPDFEQVVLNQGELYGKNISHYFPLIRNAITPFDDPKEEFARLNRELEDVQAARRKQKRKLSPLGKLKATTVIIVLCVLVFGLDHLISSVGNYMISSVSVALGAYYRNAIIVYHQFWRFITVGLHHLSIWHLLMNMFSLRVLGPQLEESFGWKKFLLILIFSTFTGSLLMYVVDTTPFAVGISGGLYGCMAAYFVYAYSRGLFRVGAFRNAIMQTLFLNLMINLMPNVAVSAHLGGFLGGLLISFFLIDYKPWQPMKKHAAIAAMVILIFLGYRGITEKKTATLYYEDLEMIEIYRDAHLDGLARHLSEQAAEYYQIRIGE